MTYQPQPSIASPRKSISRRIRTAASVVALLFLPVLVQAQFAGSWISYSQGSGANPSYNNPSRALGMPTVDISYQNADPFNPPFLSSDIVGVGTGGSLTLQFNTPVFNTPGNPFGLDFIVFGHAGFNITNAFDENFNYIGTPATDGSFFTGGDANVRVSVSADGLTFFTLNPALAPMVDGLFPTDASGNPFAPVNPALTAGDFAGQTLDGIRALYNGSGGGAGFDLAWAINGLNQSVSLPSIEFVRFEVLSGVAYLDAVTMVPEPATGALLCLGAALLWRRRIR